MQNQSNPTANLVSHFRLAPSRNILIYVNAIPRLTKLPTRNPRLQLANPPTRALPTPPLVSCVEPNQPLCANCVAIPVQIRNIYIQRTIQPGITEQLLDRTQRAAKRVRRSPVFTRQQRQANLTGQEVDVGVAYLRFECDFRWSGRIVAGDRDGEEPEAAGIGRGVVAWAFQHGLPLEEVFFIDWAEVQAGFAGG